MELSELESRILRAAARAAGGLVLHFEASAGEPGYLLAGGQRLELQDPEAVPRLIQAGLLTPDMGRMLRLTSEGLAQIQL